MTIDTRSRVAARQPRVRLHALSQALLAASLGAGTLAAHAATLYLPPCDDCTLSSGPPAGDEWVVQGKHVSTVGAFATQGILTNQAQLLTNLATLNVTGPQAALVNQAKLVNDNVIALGHPQSRLVNQATFLNNGTINAPIGLIDNVAGQFTNVGSIKAADRLRNRAGARLTNTGSIDLATTGHLDNDLGATLTNQGTIKGSWDAKLTNAGRLQNQSGATLHLGTVVNTGRLVNEAGATLDSGRVLNQAGSLIVNHGTIQNKNDGVFELAGDYDFTGGTFNNDGLSSLRLKRDFTFGGTKSGVVNLGGSGSVHNEAHAQVAQGATQVSAGGFYNHAQFTNRGVFIVKGLGAFINDQGATVTNEGAGTFEVWTHSTNNGQFSNKGRLLIAQEALVNKGVLDNTGTVAFGAGKLVNSGVFHNRGQVRLDTGSYDFTGGTFNNGKGGVLTLDTGFTFGAAQSGVVNLGAGGRLNVLSSLTNQAGHVQVNNGEIQVAYAPFTNAAGATFVNNGSMQVAGKFEQNGVFAGNGSYEQIEGPVSLRGAMAQKSVKFSGGSVRISNGASLSADHVTFGFNASVTQDGGTVSSRNEIVNAGIYRIGGAGAVFNGHVRNGSDARLLVTDTQVQVNGNLVNEGYFEQKGAQSMTSVQDLVVGDRGVVKAEGSLVVGGDVINHSSQAAAWDTDSADLHLVGTGQRAFALGGRDLGSTAAGFAEGNFVWDAIRFDSQAQWTFTDGNDEAGAALYLHSLSFLDGLDGIKRLHGDFNIYYDVQAKGNEFLGGQTYALGSGIGRLIGVNTAPVPEPGTWALVLAGLGLVVCRSSRAGKRS